MHFLFVYFELEVYLISEIYSLSFSGDKAKIDPNFNQTCKEIAYILFNIRSRTEKFKLLINENKENVHHVLTVFLNGL